MTNRYSRSPAVLVNTSTPEIASVCVVLGIHAGAVGAQALPVEPGGKTDEHPLPRSRSGVPGATRDTNLRLRAAPEFYQWLRNKIHQLQLLQRLQSWPGHEVKASAKWRAMKKSHGIWLRCKRATL